MLKFAVDNKSQKMYSGAYHFREVTVDLVDGKADWEVSSETREQIFLTEGDFRNISTDSPEQKLLSSFKIRQSLNT